MTKLISTFIEKADKIHNNKYDYTTSIYVKKKTKISIICPTHGKFEQRPEDHLKGSGCPKCGIQRRATSKTLTLKVFIEKSSRIHNSKYDYSSADYRGANLKIKIICPEHGEFIQRAADHLNGNGCSKCAYTRKPQKIDFIKKAKKIYGNKYNYSLIDYKNAKTKVEIICPEHGVFLKYPSAHLQGQGCQKCSADQKSKNNILTNSIFFKRAYKIHKDNYDYSYVKYRTSSEKISIICKTCNHQFDQTPNNHLAGSGCPKCKNMNSGCTQKLSTGQFIEKSDNTHNNIYDYSQVDYKRAQSKVRIICSKHGEFLQKPNNHIMGQGCPKCAHHGFNPDKEATLYYIKDKDTGLYKIGITNNSLYNRFGKAFLESRAEILMEETYENGQDAYLAEQEILQAFKPYRCNNDTWPEAKGGKTEFFNRNILEL